MTLEEIEQAILELSPDEADRLRAWLTKIEAKTRETASKHAPLDPEMRERIRKTRGLYKGRGIMKAFLEERCKDRT